MIKDRHKFIRELIKSCREQIIIAHKVLDIPIKNVYIELEYEPISSYED